MDAIGLIKIVCQDCGERVWYNGVSAQKLKLQMVFQANDRRVLEGVEAFVPHLCGACSRCGLTPDSVAEQAQAAGDTAGWQLLELRDVAKICGLERLEGLALEDLRAQLHTELALLVKRANKKLSPAQKASELRAEIRAREAAGDVKARAGRDPA